MSLHFAKKTETKQNPTSTDKGQPSAQTPALLATIKQSLGLKFSNGYEFTISYEKGKMIISASMNEQEAFYLDDIPEEFIDSLRRMLG